MARKTTLLQQAQKNVPHCDYHVDIPLSDLPHCIKQYDMNIDPEYQRGHVWTPDQQSKFMGSLLEHHKSIPDFWINWPSRHHGHSEVVDGKQRITACLDFLNGKFKAQCPCGIKIHYDDLTEIDIRSMMTSCSLSFNFVTLAPKAVMQFYVRLNGGGTIHTSAEIERVKNLIRKH